MTEKTDKKMNVSIIDYRIVRMNNGINIGGFVLIF
jgi:hypothetical protein